MLGAMVRRASSLSAAASGVAALGLSLLAVSACGATDPEPDPAAAPPAAATTSTSPAEAVRAAAPPTRTADGGNRGESFGLDEVADGLKAPTWVGRAPGDEQGLWVAQQDGRVLRITNGRPSLRISIASRTRASGEQGLLGVAFLPDFARSQMVVLHSTNRSGDTRVELWRLGSTARRAKLVRTLLRVDQPYANHNGGQLAFGEGNRLYLGLGDGGSADDPERRAQDLSTKLGKLLVATVTPTNRPSWKVAAYGLRNPWRFWFDPQEKEFWIADVGQSAVEEISRIPARGKPRNLGWSRYEGRRRNPNGDSRLRGSGKLVWPVIQYDHDEGCSVTGGEIYRGSSVPALKGRYVFGDFCSGTLWSAEPTSDGGVGTVRREQATLPQLTSFGSGPDGELYATTLSGEVHRLIAAD